MTENTFLEHITELVQIRKLYQEFIVNYNKLNKLFDLNNPIEIFRVFNFLLSNGYLSINHNFDYSEINGKDFGMYPYKLIGLAGVEIFRGKGACKNIAPLFNNLLNDILNNSDSFSSLLMCTYYNKKKPDIIEKIFGNHIINFAVQDNKKYFLDPTNFHVYISEDNSNNILHDSLDKNVKVHIKLVTTLLFSANNNDDFMGLSLSHNLGKNYPCASKEEIQYMTQRTKRIFDNNQDIFEKFYHENEALYNDIVTKSLKFKNNN